MATWCAPSPPTKRADSSGQSNPDRNRLNRTETDEVTQLELGKGIGKYPVAIGAPESPTPAGSYAVTKMDPQPVYHKKGKVIAPCPNNPVGVRYVAYVQIGTGEYAIHGTAWPNWVKLRAAVSLGCIRMLNSDVIQVYNRIEVGTPVVVTN